MVNIFTVTGVVWDCPKSPSRTFGWYPFFEEAEEAVYANRGGMDEASYYQWIVIEEVPDGVWNASSKETWYEWDGDQYNKIDKPDKFHSFVNWGIG